jgi:adenylate cyclase
VSGSALVKALTDRSTKLAAAILIGALGSVLLLIPQIRDLEQDIGLRWLFQLRGPLDPPTNVILVTMNLDAARNIFLPRDPEKYHRCIDLRVGTGTPNHESLPPIPARWPRCLHAILTQKLQRAGANTIVFDVLFRQRAPQVGLNGDVNAEQDAALAAAMTASGNVVIAQKYEQFGLKTAEEQVLTISPNIEDAAIGIGPFQLVPSASKRVDRYQLFREDGLSTPSLPVLVLQAYSLPVYPALQALLAAESRDAAEFLPVSVDELKKGKLQIASLLLRDILQKDPTLAVRLGNAAQMQRLTSDKLNGRIVGALLSTYSGEPSRLLNFVGPAGRIPAIGFDQALALPDSAVKGDRQIFKDKVVFIGYAEMSQAEQSDHFSSVYSGVNGIDLSGVEIAATAFSNLMEDSSIREAPTWISVVVVFLAGSLAATLCLFLNFRIAIPLAAVLTIGYFGLAVHLFSVNHLWLPIVVPLLISAPAGTAYATVQRYWEARRQRDKVRTAFRFFVPSEIAEELEKNAGHIVATRKSLECVCVATDAARFTTLAEGMASEALTDFLNEYFDSLFKPVIDHGGFVSDVVGDAMLAIWPDRTPDTRQVACHALLEMRDAADEFNRLSAGNRLITRFGANWGKVTLATVGARAHYEYRAVGDPVNTANRIQELNKKFGTRILVSKTLIEGLENFATRDMGSFLLRGKAAPERIFELMNTRALATTDQVELAVEFGKALLILGTGAKAAALAAFQDIRARHPGDGATAFYIQYLLSGKTLDGTILSLD